MTNSEPQPTTSPPTLEQDWKTIKEGVGLAGTAIAIVLLVSPAAFATASNPQTTFINALLFTLPLSLGVAVWALGLIYVEDLQNYNWGSLLWTVGVAAVALALSGSVGGAPVQIVITPRGGPIPTAIGFVGDVLEGFLTAYGPGAFISAFIVGGLLVYLWLKVAHRRIEQGL